MPDHNNRAESAQGDRLAPGQYVKVRGRYAQQWRVTHVYPSSTRLDHVVWEGRPDWIDLDSNSLGLLGQTVRLNRDAKISDQRRTPSTLAAVTNSMVVTAKGQPGQEGLSAYSVRFGPMDDFLYSELRGHVTAHDADANRLRVAGHSLAMHPQTLIGKELWHPRHGARADAIAQTPFAIGCSGGSGSRLLRDMLATCPKVYLDRDCSPLNKDSHGFKYFFKRASALREQDRARALGTLLAALHQQMENPSSFECFGWKNPESIGFADAIMRAHPDMRFIHLVRHPGAMSESRLQKRLRKQRKQRGGSMPQGNRAESILRQWARENESVWDRWNGHPRYTLVHYEDLVDAPLKTLSTLCAWLGVERAALSEAGRQAARSLILPPPDARLRGRNVDMSVIAAPARKLGYGHPR